MTYKKTKAMGKYNKQLHDEIIQWVRENGLIDYGGARLLDFCSRFKLHSKTYYRWLEEKTEFKEAIDEAKAYFKSSLTQDIVVSLARTAKGYDREETETEYIPNEGGKLKIRRKKKKTVHYQPNVAAGIFLLTNLDPEHYQNKQRMDVGGKLDTKIDIGFVDADIAPVENEEDVDI